MFKLSKIMFSPVTHGFKVEPLPGESSNFWLCFDSDGKLVRIDCGPIAPVDIVAVVEDWINVRWLIVVSSGNIRTAVSRPFDWLRSKCSDIPAESVVTRGDQSRESKRTRVAAESSYDVQKAITACSVSLNGLSFAVSGPSLHSWIMSLDTQQVNQGRSDVSRSTPTSILMVSETRAVVGFQDGTIFDTDGKSLGQFSGGVCFIVEAPALDCTIAGSYNGECFCKAFDQESFQTTSTILPGPLRNAAWHGVGHRLLHLSQSGALFQTIVKKGLNHEAAFGRSERIELDGCVKWFQVSSDGRVLIRFAAGRFRILRFDETSSQGQLPHQNVLLDRLSAAEPHFASLKRRWARFENRARSISAIFKLKQLYEQTTGGTEPDLTFVSTCSGCRVSFSCCEALKILMKVEASLVIIVEQGTQINMQSTAVVECERLEFDMSFRSPSKNERVLSCLVRIIALIPIDGEAFGYMVSSKCFDMLDNYNFLRKLPIKALNDKIHVFEVAKIRRRPALEGKNASDFLRQFLQPEWEISQPSPFRAVADSPVLRIAADFDGDVIRIKISGARLEILASVKEAFTRRLLDIVSQPSDVDTARKSLLTERSLLDIQQSLGAIVTDTKTIFSNAAHQSKVILEKLFQLWIQISTS